MVKEGNNTLCWGQMPTGTRLEPEISLPSTKILLQQALMRDYSWDDVLEKKRGILNRGISKIFSRWISKRQQRLPRCRSHMTANHPDYSWLASSIFTQQCSDFALKFPLLVNASSAVFSPFWYGVELLCCRIASILWVSDIFDLYTKGWKKGGKKTVERIFSINFQKFLKYLTEFRNFSSSTPPSWLENYVRQVAQVFYYSSLESVRKCWIHESIKCQKSVREYCKKLGKLREPKLNLMSRIWKRIWTNLFLNCALYNSIVVQFSKK